MDCSLILTDVTKKYDDFVLDHVNISLPYGCIMGFIGENGAGKTTTIKLIMDLIKRDEGSIQIFGKDSHQHAKSIKEHLGVVMEDSYFPDNLTVTGVNQILRSLYRTWDETKYKSLVRQLNLPEEKNIKEFSKGMKMKLSIAAALSHDTHLLILDEATSGLDPIVREEILDVFLEFIQDERNSVFISSHILSDLEKVCDYITFIHKGKIVFSDNKDDLLDSYGVLKCSEADLRTVNPNAVIGCRKNSFGVEALVLKNKVKRGLMIDQADIEDIMLYHVKEDRY